MTDKHEKIENRVLETEKWVTAICKTCRSAFSFPIHKRQEIENKTKALEGINEDT